MVTVGFAHNAVQQLMLFQMLPVFRTVIAFVGIDGRTFGYPFQQRRQVVASWVLAWAVCWKKVLMENPLNVRVGF